MHRASWDGHYIVLDISNMLSHIYVPIYRSFGLQAEAPSFGASETHHAAALCDLLHHHYRVAGVPWARPVMVTTACCQASPWVATAAWPVTGPWQPWMHGLDPTCLQASYQSAWLQELRWLRGLEWHLAR